MRFTICLTFSVLLSCGKEQPRPAEQQMEKLAVKTGAVLVEEAKEKLVEAKEKLIAEGKYQCCVKDPCNHCALHGGSCDCYKDVKSGEHVCIECFAEWQQGKGAVEGIQKSSVKADIGGSGHGEH